MRRTKIIAVCASAVAVAGCIAHTRPENAALVSPWAPESPAPLLAYAPPDADYPSVGGDILKGASPSDLAAARAAAQPPAGARVSGR